MAKSEPKIVTSKEIRELKVTITTTPASGDSSPESSGAPAEVNESIKAFTTINNASENKKKQDFYAHIVERSANIFRAETERTLSRVWSLQENYIAEQNFSNVASTVNFTKGLASSVMAGAAFGIGGIAASVAVWGIQTGINAYERKLSYVRGLNEQNYRTEFAATRIGLTDGSRGTDN